MTAIDIAEIKATLKVLCVAQWIVSGATAILVLMHAAQFLEKMSWGL